MIFSFNNLLHTLVIHFKDLVYVVLSVVRNDSHLTKLLGSDIAKIHQEWYILQKQCTGSASCSPVGLS